MIRLSEAANRAYDLAWDARLGVATGGVHCRPTSYRVLRRVFAKLPLSREDCLVDLGCGKGRVVCFAARHPIASVTGVEIDPETAAHARVNVAALKARRAADVVVVNASASEIDCRDGTVFYFFNPFGADIFASVVANIRDSLAANPRSVRIVYFNPVFRTLLDGADWLGPAEGLFNDRAGNPAVLLYRNV